MTEQVGFNAFMAWCSEHRPEYAVVLGSGLTFPHPDCGVRSFEMLYNELPGFRKPSVAGHRGVLRLTEWDGYAVVVFDGRGHLYEGCSFEEVTRPVELIRDAGIRKLILTNSAGAVNTAANVGDVVLLEDFIIPFDIGIPDDMDYEYEPANPADPEIVRKLKRAARIEDMPLRIGTYIFMPGPAYETPAEARMLRSWGADVVGMSTAPEWWAALRAGIAVGGLSLVTNVHRPGEPPPSHEDVLEAADAGGEKMCRLLHRAVFEKGI
jgi:purine-nucleoside phosphorylase